MLEVNTFLTTLYESSSMTLASPTGPNSDAPAPRPPSPQAVARGGNRISLYFLVWSHTLIYSKLCFISKKPSREAVGKLAIGIVFFYKF